MTKIFSFLASLVLLFAVAQTISAQVTIKPVLHSQSTVGHNNSFEFTADWDSSWEPHKRKERKNSILWVFGDGTFDFSSIHESIFHTYHSTPQHAPYALATQIKDDDDDPIVLPFPDSGSTDAGHRFLSDILLGNTPLKNFSSSRTNEPVNMKGSAYRLIANRNPKPGDIVTYVITYQNYCDTPKFASIDFKFDSDVFESKYTYKSYHGESHSNLGNWLKWDFSIPSGEQRNIFVTLKTKNDSGLIGVEVNNDISLTDGTGEPLCPSNPNPEIPSQKVVHSHDPNFKYIEEAPICLGEIVEEQWREYYIEFQNIGAGPADSVTVIDLLHGHLDWTSVVFDCNDYLQSKFSTNPSTGINCSFSRIGNTVQWEFTGLNLRGMGEPGYGTDFHPEDTKGWLRFRAHSKIGTQLSPCGAVPNRAEIIFDCNPSIFTNNALSRVACFECFFCEEQVFVLDTIPFGSDIITTEITSNLSGSPSDYSYEWYPTDLVTNPTVLNTVLTPTQTTDYTLIVSRESPCERYIFHKRIKVDCISSLDIVLDKVSQMCTPTQTASIQASVTGNAPPFTWNSCEQTSTINLNNLSEGTYHLQVKDANGCWTDTLVHIEAPLPLWVDIDIDQTSCTARTLVSGGFGPNFSYQWNNSSSSPSIPVAPSTNYSVTVKDGEKCVFVRSFSTDASCQIVGIEALSPFENQELLVYPNPSIQSSQLQFAVKKTADYQVQIIDRYGRTHTHKSYLLQSGEQKLTLDLQDLPQGFYFVVLSHQAFRQTAKLMIVR